jgi:hypothetical protein
MTAKWQYKLQSFEKVKLFVLNTKKKIIIMIYYFKKRKIQMKIFYLKSKQS